MRIRRINLPSFGRFTNFEIGLPDSNGLHVLSGGNEAGKTTLLDAITYTLHGMPHAHSEKTPAYGFLHPLPKVRSGLVLVSDDGDEIDLLRKRGRAGTVLDPATDSASAERQAQLDTLMRGVGADVWRMRHGLTQARLRKGSTELLESNGDAADALFAAATGITVVRRVLQDVRERRRQILADSGQKGDLKQPLKDFEEASAIVRQQRAAISSFDSDVNERRELDAEQKQLASDKARIDAQAAQLAGVRAALGDLAIREQLVAERDAIDAPAIEWTKVEHEQLQQLTRQLVDSTAAAATLEQQVATATAALGELVVDDALLSIDGDVTALQERVATFRDAREQLPDQRAAVGMARQALSAAARAADMDTALDIDDLAGRIPTRAVRERLLDAARELDRLERAVAAADEHVAKDQVSATAAVRALDALDVPDADDVQRLTAILDAAGGLDVDGLREQRVRTTRMREALEARAAALPGCAFDLASARAATLPAVEETDAIVAAFTALDEQAGVQRTALEQAREHQLTRQAELDALIAGVDVPDHEQLGVLRRERDGIWAVVRAGVLDSVGADSAQVRAAAVEAVPKLDDALHASDTYADAIARDGQRVGTAETLRAQIEADERREQAATVELARIAAERDELRAGTWTRAWTRCGIEPAEPATMAQLRVQLEQLRREAGELDSQEVSVAAQLQRITAAVGELAALLHDEPMVDDERDPVDRFDVLVERARAERDRAAKLANDHAARTEAVRATRDALHDAVEAQTAAAAALAAHASGGWTDACREAGVASSELTHHDAIRYCDALGALDAAIDELRVATVTSEATAATIDRFTGDVEALVGRLGDADQQLRDLPSDLAVSRIAELVTATREARIKRASKQEALDELVPRFDAATASRAQARAALDQLIERTGLDEGQLDVVDAAWRGRDEIQQRIAAVEQRLIEQTHMPIAELVELRGGRDDVQLAERVAQLMLDAGQIDAALAQVTERRDELVARIDAAQRSEALAIAMQDQANALATIERLVEEHRSLALQEQLLTDFVDEQLAGDMGPVVQLASDYFRRLTCERYEGIHVDADDGGTLRIRARPAGGAAADSIEVGDMSEGTRDQLFLALRLATLVQALDTGVETMPLIVDDILMTFDDPRSRATLQLLGELSERMQIVFLTHHDHLVDLANDAVDPARLHVVQLSA